MYYINHQIILSVFLFFCKLNVLCSQPLPIVSTFNDDMGYTCERLNNNELSQEQIKYTLRLIQNSEIKDTALLACCYHQIARNYYIHNNLIESINFYKKAKQLRITFNDNLLWLNYLNLGINYFELGQYELAIRNLTKSLYEPGFKENLDSVNIYRTLGNSYAEIGDYENAIDFGKLAAKDNIKTDTYNLNYAKMDVANTLIRTKNTNNVNSAIEYANEVYKTGTDKSNEIYALFNLAEAYAHLKNFNKSLHFYKLIISSVGQDTLERATVLNNIGILYKNKYLHQSGSSLNAAIDTLKISLNLHKDYYGTNTNYFYSPPYENLADAYTALQQFDTALLHYQKALINLTNNFRIENIFQNPNPKDTTLFLYSNPDMIRVLHLKATAAYQYYQHNNNIKYLSLANQCYQTAFDFHDKLQKDISTENSRLFQAKNIVPYIENALKIAYQQQENGQDISKAAFRFMEKNKATVLLQSMNEADALQFANLPDSLLMQEKDLKIALTFHSKQLNEAIEYEDTTEIERLNRILFEEKQKYSQLINYLENNYPNYYRLKYQQNQTQLNKVQKALDNQTALLEYFVGDSSIYIVSILKDHTHLFKVKKPSNWKQIINNLRQSISYVYQNDKALFAKNSRYLSQLILDPVLCTLPEEITRLQIIPDAELNYIPFEVLLTENVDKHNIQYKNLAYLLQSKSIGYAYSAALWLENKQSTTTASTTMAYGGYAPVYFGKAFNDLPIARRTVKVLADSYNGHYYINDKASLPNFLNDQNNYSVLHLAMHGVLNDENPLSSYLAFYPKDKYKLYAYDLYNMKINSDLTILHACNTGTGELQKGEGVMSLSRAFTYAGCPSLVMSLWQIPEEATAEITQLFLEYLQSGQTKDVALQQAKLSYLKAKPERLASPASWAGLVANGNLEALDF